MKTLFIVLSMWCLISVFASAAFSAVMVYTKTINGVDGIVNVCGPAECWRLIHDGQKVLALFESGGITETLRTIFAGTYEECLAEIERLGLEYDAENWR